MSEEIRRGALYVVSTPIGNLGDITMRAASILSGVDLIAAEDTRVTRVLLDHLGVKKPLVSYFSRNERRRSRELVEALRKGESVAVVTDAGTPGISDPAWAVVREAIDAGIPVIPAPGASALLAALVISGLPTERFVFEGFLPLKKGRKTRLAFLAGEPRTIVLYESPHRIERTLRDVLEAMGDRPVALVREVTKKFEEVRRGAVSEVIAALGERAPRGEFVLVIAGTSYRAGAPSPDDAGS
ncbi:MAG TPA: 16S rRNA (cytidine(1402)-2'-O)-methyltransferase [Bacteroidota bacterium]|nr:16S rRNA (cytidine(1402)-2'-O)-methyltransferase [Bacteroidota bacterium]